MNRINRTKGCVILIQVGIFAFLMLFWIKLCPLLILNMDDWNLIMLERLPIPIWKGWNPTRVLPETLYPLCGRIAAYVLYPLCGDLILAVRIAVALCMSALVTGLCMAVAWFARRRLQVRTWQAVFLELFFFAGCFLIFRNRAGSTYLFHADSLAVVVYYTASGTLNGIVMLLMLGDLDFTKTFRQWHLWQKVLFIIGAYFAVFSNLFHSGMLACCCLVSLVPARDDGTFRRYLQRRLISILLLCGFGVACVFEFFGGRADSVSSGGLDLKGSLQQLSAMLQALAKPYVAILLLLVVLWFVRCRKDRTMKLLLRNTLLYEILITVFLILLCSKVLYMSRVEASFGIWLGLVVLGTELMAAQVRRNDGRTWQKPVETVLLMGCLVMAILPGGGYKRSVNIQEYDMCEQMEEEIINSILTADAQGVDEITVLIPDYSDQPDALILESEGQYISDALSYYGLISNKVTVHGSLVSREEYVSWLLSQ